MSRAERIPPITDADVERFLANAPGYESGAPKIVIPGLPGDERVIQFKHGLYEMTDQYVVTPAGWSTGVTKVRYDGETVHAGHYGGFYPERVLWFLKFALKQPKTPGEFAGGRGPRFFPDERGTLVYVNTPEPGSTFSRYHGKEEIFDVRTGTSLGFHEYWGMSFLSPYRG